MIQPLTSLRFVFALLVFMSHLWFLEDCNDGMFNALHQNLLKEGFIGVSFFFILSGFVLSYSYKERLQNKQLSLSKYWIARVARIYPLHLLTLILAIPLSLQYMNEGLWYFKLLLNATLLHGFTPSDGYYFTFNSVSWSLSGEIFFYLAFPLLVTLLSKKAFRIAIPVVYTVLILVGIYFIRDIFHHALFYVNPLVRTGDFIIGMLLYRLYQQTKDTSILRKRRSATIAEVASIALLGIFVLFHQYIPVGYRYSVYYWLPMAVIIYTFAFSGGAVSKVLSHKWLVYLGEISFGMYMIHILVFKYYYLLHLQYPVLGLNIVTAVALLAFTIILSILSYKYFEIPVNKYIKNHLSEKIRARLSLRGILRLK